MYYTLAIRTIGGMYDSDTYDTYVNRASGAYGTYDTYVNANGMLYDTYGTYADVNVRYVRYRRLLPYDIGHSWLYLSLFLPPLNIDPLPLTGRGWYRTAVYRTCTAVPVRYYIRYVCPVRYVYPYVTYALTYVTCALAYVSAVWCRCRSIPLTRGGC